MALTQHGPQPQPAHTSISLPLIVCAFYIESVQFVRCVYEVRVIQMLQQIYCFDKRHHFTEK